jgi:hypothetical protein
MSTPTIGPRVMPPQDNVRRMLSDLFGRPVVVSRNPPLIRQATDKFTVAMFTKEDGVVGVVALADLQFTAYAGAALTMFPTPMAERQIENGEVDEMVLENFREIMNVCASQFNGANAAHVKLTELLRLPKDKLAPDVEAKLRRPVARLDFTVQIPNYGKGRLSFLSV